ncbi:MAG: hypothetical protein H7Y07_06385 [Pyrinomonadaceae bacterium]|nr:hypothetical protein [Sphingobacteriaceae bacterium]
MISIIICSINAQNLAKLKVNIKETIGVPFELIAIDNSKTSKGICRVYNQGAQQAKFPVLCFVHEDVLFATLNWGRNICEHLSDKQTGLLGLAGGDSKSRVPSSWSIPIKSNEINIYQHYKREKKEPMHIVETSPGNASKKRVVALDGVFLCTRKDVFEQFQFDEKTFTGFHGYDIDFSLQVNTKYNNYVIFDIVVHHFSDGTPDKKWIESAKLISNKWKKALPVSIYPLAEAEANLYHWKSLQVFLQKLFELKYPLPIIFQNYLVYSFNQYFTVRRFVSMGKYVFLSSLKKPNSLGRNFN